MLLRTLKSGIEIHKTLNSCGEYWYTAIDPKGYIGRTRITQSYYYNILLEDIRDYIKQNKSK